MVFLVECSWIQNELGGISSSSFLAIAAKPGAMQETPPIENTTYRKTLSTKNTIHRKCCQRKNLPTENPTCIEYGSKSGVSIVLVMKIGFPFGIKSEGAILVKL